MVIAIVGTISFALVAWLGYELGRYRAGYVMLDVRREAEQRDSQIAAQAAQIESLERQIAILETAREIDAQAYADVEGNLDQLETQILEQQERLRFYQGIVSPEDGEAGLRIQDFEVIPGTSEANYVVRVLLVQAIVHNDRVTGSVVLTLNGSANGEENVLDLGTLSGEEFVNGVPYAFRYFQSVEFPLTLPAGFVADSVEVQVVPESPRGEAWSESFAWRG